MRRVRCVSVASVLRQVAFTQAFAASSRCFGNDDDGVLKVPVCGVPQSTQRCCGMPATYHAS